jgi:antitoxin component of MazEF toxin-antitoxin module
MSSAKLQKIGNSLGFRISKHDLEAAGFDENSEYELVAEKGIILLLKRRSHHSKWSFKNTGLTAEDRQWLESKLESGNK